MKKIVLYILFFTFLTSFCLAKTQKEEYQNDFLYSEEYFDYLIECAQNHKNDDQKAESKEISLESELKAVVDEDEIAEEYEPFKLRIQTDSGLSPYGETFKKVNSKTIIPVGEKFSVVQNMTKTRNKYNSNDYRALIGAEYSFNKYLGVASGLETNYRGLDQNPTSRKLYFSPSFKFGEKVSLTFHNKMNVQSYSTDHDLGLNVSPFKSKVVDFGVYAGLTRNKSGSHSESVNFSTNFYFF